MRFKNLLLALIVSSPQGLLAQFDLNECSDPALKQSCQLIRANEQVSCLQDRIQRIQRCNSLMDDYEKKLQEWIYQKVQEKGQGVIDPLKVEKSKHLQKLKELENILKWHDLNIKFTSEKLVSLLKDFTNSYKSTEIPTRKKLQDLLDSTLKVKDYLDLIEIRFELQSLLADEKRLSQIYLDRSIHILIEIQGCEKFVIEKLRSYQEYLDQSNLSNSAPKFEKEIALAEGITKYAQQRNSQIETIGNQISQYIARNISEHEKIKIQKDKERSFKTAKDIGRETVFFEQVTQFIRDALLQTDRAEFYDFEFVGTRIKGIQKLLSLEVVCNSENLKSPGNEWMSWGCQKYEEHAPTARKYMNKVYPQHINNALKTMEWDRPGYKKEEINKVRELLNAGMFETAIDSYDLLLKEFSSNSEGR